MRAIEWIAEQRIREAIEQGKLNNLPGSGHPVRLELDHHLPAELRLAYTILKNAGFVPPLIELRRRAELEMESLDTYIQTCSRYARAFRTRIVELASKLQRAERNANFLTRPHIERQRQKLAGMVQSYASFRRRCRHVVLERLEKVESYAREVREEWLRENQRRSFGHGIDLTLLPVNKHAVLERLEASLPELEPDMVHFAEMAGEDEASARSEH